MNGVARMFDGIAPTYDALNRLLSLGIDQRWRRRAVEELGPIAGRRVLDLCAGTLDLSRLLEQAGGRVVAADFALEMLQRGRHKCGAPLVRGDALHLPFANGSFEGVVCGFGLRNLADPAAGLAEARRVLAPGGRLVVLEFFRPDGALNRAVQALYHRHVLPWVGGLVSGAPEAYRYLAASIAGFASRGEVEALARRAGFAQVRSQDLTAGIAGLVVAS